MNVDANSSSRLLIACTLATAIAGCVVGDNDAEYIDSKSNQGQSRRADDDEKAVQIGPVERSHDAASGLWVTIRNRLPIHRDPSSGDVISQMFIPVSWLSADQGGKARTGDDGKDENEEDERNGSSDAHKMFRLHQSILSEREQTFFLSEEQAAQLFEKGSGGVRVSLRDSVQLGSLSSPCSGVAQINRPGAGVKERLVVEVQKRFQMSYGCSMHVESYNDSPPN